MRSARGIRGLASRIATVLITIVCTSWTPACAGGGGTGSDGGRATAGKGVPSEGFVTDWLICGPFPSEEMAVFYEDNLEELGGEAAVEPKEGLEVTTRSIGGGIESWYGKTAWRRHQAPENGYVDFGSLYAETTGELSSRNRKVAYAYMTVDSPARRRVLLQVRTDDALQMWVNHREVIYNHLFRGGYRQGGVDLVVADLEAGPNGILVKIGDYRYGGWGFAFKVVDAQDPIYVNRDDILLPHLRIGEKLAGWGSISLVNTTAERLSGLAIEVKASDLFERRVTELEPLEPGWDSRAPFRIETKRRVVQGDSGAAKLDLVIRPGSGKHDGNVEERPAGETRSARASGKSPGPTGTVAQTSWALSTALRQGIPVILAPEVRNRALSFRRTYLSGVDGSVQFYSLLVPPTCDGTRPFPLIVVLHGAHVRECIDAWQPKDWAIIVTAYGRGNTGYREIGTDDVFSVVDEVKKAYRIDENRTYLAGHSMGGHGTWYLGMHYPDRWAALNPMSGYGDYRFGGYSPREVPAWQIPLYVARSAAFVLENALHLPVFDVHGAKDDDVTVEQSRALTSELKKLDYKVVYDEHPDKGHWWGMDFPNAVAFLKEQVRDPVPREVVLRTNRLQFNQSYWVRIDRIDRVPDLARMRAKILDDNRIEVISDNVRAFTLILDDRLVAPGKPVTVATKGDVEPSTAVCPEPATSGVRHLSFERVARPSSGESGASELFIYKESSVGPPGAGAASSSGSGLLKTHDLFGPIIDAYSSQFLYVYGTSGTPEDAQANLAAVRQDALDWRTWANGNARMKADRDVTQSDIDSMNLVLYGGPASNLISARIGNQLPIRLDGNRVVVGEKEYEGKDIGLKMIYPNPLNRRRYVLLNAASSPLAMGWMRYVGDPLYDPLPDYVVFERQRMENDRHDVIDAGYFDGEWKLGRPKTR